ncbi:twin-arginine translocase TatA/TatE family subunit [Oceanispirochaeta crateris]|jgi:sec-independent protein translocase protein TatA|uniref:Twin-arginine translocase TatA/TatE family subunit n=1 Tax=Oceanispirochaeta crateris TaxID=2518645 RepID=A0A5C1QGG8_9SPIO|nr:twin-arginine translocase TatA/TatE family subunit [Oceanispirochaeta crateris]QEN06631.1 twin-arginine translocase TatA/TatE family subunit [Oceanispirochaeta crateris]
MLGTTEVMVIGGVVVLLFGASAIPKFAKSLGKAKKEFKEGLEEGDSEMNESDNNKTETKEK